MGADARDSNRLCTITEQGNTQNTIGASTSPRMADYLETEVEVPAWSAETEVSAAYEPSKM